jgi:stage V sporulation protein SpoVS
VVWIINRKYVGGSGRDLTIIGYYADIRVEELMKHTEYLTMLRGPNLDLNRAPQ